MKLPILLFSPFIFAFSQAEDVEIFNGKNLDGWEGEEGLWSVADGAIVGETNAESPLDKNTFLIWKGGDVDNFTMTFDYQFNEVDGGGYGNSGVQYRSKLLDPEKFVVGGYQADFEYGKKFSGILYEERGRKILAKRGEVVEVTSGEDPMEPVLNIKGHVKGFEKIQPAITNEDWNQYKIVADGTRVQHFINGMLCIDVTDLTPEAPLSGILALQLHKGSPMKVQFKNFVYTPIEEGSDSQFGPVEFSASAPDAAMKAAGVRKEVSAPKEAATE